VLNWYSVLKFSSGTNTPANIAEAEKYKWRAVRITTGNSCGSGSLCGRDAKNIYILTNAHVATNRPGNVVNCEAALIDKTGTERFRAVVIEGAYSSRDTTDWALLRAEADHMKGIEPIKLSVKMPDHSKASYTWGCPRCEVPSGQVITTVVKDGLVWKWNPPSIGGQSGSGVHQRGFQHGLLTWLYSGPNGGVGAGQYTATIFKQSKEQSNVSEKRSPGLEPVAINPTDDLIDGYAVENASVRLATLAGDWDTFVENGTCFDGYTSESSVNEFPIWGDPDATDPVDPTDPVEPEPGTPGLSVPDQKKLNEAIRLIEEVLVANGG
jgi:hypothetical protein